MDAVSVIKNNLDVEKVLRHYKVDFKYYGDYIRCACPIHNGDNPTAFVINEDFLWSCHTGGCGAGDVFTFVEEMEDLDFPKAVKKVAEILEIDIENLIIAERKNDYLKEVEKFLKYIKSKKKRQDKEVKEYKVRAELSQVRSFRNYKESTLIHFDLKYANEIELDKKDGGVFNLYERLVIPIIVDETKIGVSIRKIRAKDNPKWFHAPPSIETGNILYNIDSCKDYNEIIVCEGIFDVWSWYEAGFENAVCTFGAHLSEEQYRMLLRTGKDIIWSYDGDSAGLEATKKAIDMMRYKVNQWVIRLPDGADPGNCTSEMLNELYDKKEKIL